MDGLYLPPKPAIIIPRPKEIVRPDDVRFKTPLILGGLLLDPYRFARVSTLVDRTAGTTIGNMTAGGGLAAAFDNNTNQARSAGAEKNPSASGFQNFCGKDWGSGVTRIPSRAIFYCPNDMPFGTVTGLAVRFSASNDGTNYDVLATSGAINSASQHYDTGLLTSVTTAYRYWRAEIEGNGANGCGIAEIEWYEWL